MAAIVKFSLLSLLASLHAMAGTVVITSLPDESHPVPPLASLGGTVLAVGGEVRVGVFPGMSDDQILDIAAAGGLAAVSAAFVPFGDAKAIGDGVDGQPGLFEFSVRQPTQGVTAPWVGGEVSLLIKKAGGQEFLIARFKGKVFEADPDTGLEPLLPLHLAEAKMIVGNRQGRGLSTSPAPKAGSYASWIASFPSLAGAGEGGLLAGADPDGDGRSNFLEYATGGDPGAGTGHPPFGIIREDGGTWVRLARATGLGNIKPEAEWTPDLVTPWTTIEAAIEADPSAPVVEGIDWKRMRLPEPLGARGFYRLKVGPAFPEP